MTIPNFDIAKMSACQQRAKRQKIVKIALSCIIALAIIWPVSPNSGMVRKS